LRQAAAQVEEGITRGQHLGAQVYASLRGVVVADFALGEVAPGVPLAPDHLMRWLSATKPVGALALARLWEQGRVDLEAPVALYVPGFEVGGKEAITLRQVLTHTGGFRSRVDLEWPGLSWEESVERVCAAPLERNWVPGKKAGYHIASGWIILGEVVQRVGGRSFAEYVRQEVFLPLGLEDCWVGMPGERYRAYGPRLSGLFDTSGGKVQRQEFWEGEETATRCLPAGGGKGPMRELGVLYEQLLAGGGGQWTAETVRLFTSRQRAGLFDHTFGAVIDWGLGFVLDSKQYGPEIPYGYGDHCSPATYGHSGRQCCAAFADPACGLVVAAAFNGMPGEQAHGARMRALLNAVYTDLGLN